MSASATRRAVIGSLAGAGLIATATVLPASALSAESDPIFEVIEKHRMADAAYNAAIDDDGEDTTGGIAEDADATATLALCTTEPTTIGGMAALLEYLRPMYENDTLGGQNWFDNRTDDLFKTLATAAQKITHRQAVR